jgi:Rod binding domain-containing protein
MSIQPTSNAATAAGLPAVNQALEPEWVRRGSAATQKAYDSALAFEQTLVEQLSKSMADASGLGGESSSEGEAGAEAGSSSTGGAGDSQLSSMLPQALSASVMNAGGLGMAAQMTRQLEGATQTLASSGTAPAPSSDATIVATGGAGS